MQTKKMMVLWTFAATMVSPVLSDELPKQFDWRNVDGKCYVTPVKTVTDVRQIWAAVTADMLESLYLIQSGIDYNKLSPEDREKMAVSVESILAECNHVPGMAPDTNSNQGEGKDVTKTYEYLLRKGYQSKARVTDILLWQGITNAQEENSEEWLDRLSSAKAGLQRKPIFSYCYMSDNYTDSKYYFMCPHSYVTTDRCRENYRPVLVIGYDDTIPAARFKHKNFDEIPAGDGAWIVKGVHGDGIDGTFYVSYYDKNLFKYEYESFFIYPEFIAEQTQMLTLDLTNEFGQFYCHNEGSPAGIDMQDLYPRSTCANMFLASSDDMLSAVGAFGMSYSSVDVLVYTNCVAGNPLSGTLATTVKVWYDHWGYNIRRLKEQVPIKKGQWFSLVTDDTDMLVWTKSTNPQQGRSFVCPPRSEWRDTVSPNTDGVLEGNYTPKWWTRGGLNRSTCDTPFLTAYTANEQKDIELKASDGEVEEGIRVTWTPIDDAIYKIYRREDGSSVFILIEPNWPTSTYLDESDEKKANGVKLGKRKYQYYVKTTVNGVEIESNKDYGYTLETQEVPEACLANCPKPPDPSDILFVFTNDTANIGQTLKKGDWEIPLNVLRVFGDKNKLLKSEALDKNATLTIAAYDVDSRYHYKPEVDRVFLIGQNDQKIELKPKKLDGVNKSWFECSFTINTKDLNLRKSPEDVNGGKNTIKITVDENDGAWITYIKWISLEIPAAPPVVLSHGIRSDVNTLNCISNEIAKLGLPVHTFGYNNKGNDGISDGAKQLSSEVHEFRQKCKVDKVNIVAHSMGGLRAREYVELFRDCNTGKTDVWRLLQIATPNAGSPLADFVVGIPLLVDREHPEQSVWDWVNDVSSFILDMGPNDRALFELTTDYMKDYNERHKLNDDVEYSVVAGDVWFPDLWDVMMHPIDNSHFRPLERLQYEYIKAKAGANDTVVPVSSAHAVRMKNMWTREGPVTDDEYTHSGLVEDGAETVIMLFTDELTKPKRKEGGGRVSPSQGSRTKATHTRLSSEAGNSDGSSFCKQGVATLGEEMSLPFYVVEGQDVFASLMLLNGKSFSIKLLSPSGREYADTGDGHVAIVKDESLVCCCMTNVESGVWQLAFTPQELVDDSETSCPYVLIVNETNVDFALNATLDAESIRSGGSFAARVAPRLNGARLSGNVTINVGKPDGSVVSIVAQDNGLAPDLEAGDGIYSAVIPAPEVGNYPMSVRIDADAPVAFSRTTLIGGVAYASDSKLDSEISAVGEDSDGDGLNDMLLVNFPVQVTIGGAYRILATLSDLNGREVSTAWTSNIACVAGANIFPVAFDGRAIYANGKCDGYVVSSVKLLEIGDTYEAVIDERQNFFTTTDYNYRQFEHNLVEIGDGGSENAEDTDGDGIYDRLDVAFPVHVDELIAGEYHWSASLEDDMGYRLETAFGEVTFTAGQEDVTIPMSFDGKGISENMSVDGQFHVANVVIWGNGRTFRLGNKYSTRNYELLQWGIKPQSGMRFVETELLSNEGGLMSIAVHGGNDDNASSMKVYLTYNTAAAADLDLAKGAIDGVTPKGGVKFPLTLTWAKGEVGEKVITIPVKADKTVEDDEFFTLQLGDAQGMELGEERVCMVKIHDPEYDELGAKVANGTATAAEIKSWNKLQTAKAPYVRGLADPANAGKVSGSGLCAAGKKVTLKATASKGFVFVGWLDAPIAIDGVRLLPNAVEYVATTPSLVIDRTAKPTKDSATSTTITNVTGDATYYACFITSDEDKAAIVASMDGCTLEPWVSKTETHASTTNIWAGVYLEWPVASEALSATTVKVAGLPAGLKFTAKPVTSKIGSGKTAVTVTNVLANTIYGAPTAASKIGKDGNPTPSAMKLTVTTAGKSSQTYQIDTVVNALPEWAVGTFAGGVFTVQEGDSGVNALAARSASGVVSLAIAANGKISGKLLEEGLTWTLSAPWFDEARLAGDGSPHLNPETGSPTSEVRSPVFVATVIGKSGKQELTNEVAVAADEARSASGPYQRGVVAARSASGPYQDMEWEAYQNLWKAEPWKTFGKSLDKNVLAYAILADGTFSDDEEVLTSALGADVTGRVTLKLAASGAATISGEFVAGYNEKTKKYTTVKATGSATLVPVDEAHGEVFIYLTPKGLDPHARAVGVPWPQQ